MGKIKRVTSKLGGNIAALFLPKQFYFSHRGYCPCCDKNVVFKALDSWLRDFFLCSNCHSLPRERALMVIIDQYCPEWRSLSIHESSPVDRGTSKKLRQECKNYTASQFFPNQPAGVIIDGHRNENLEQQTFADACFDLVITQDVMEHIYNPEQAFSEIARSLKPGGAHIFTVPLINKHKPTEVWATLVNGKTNFLQTPEYHCNPVDPVGSPVTMHWGFDIVTYIKGKTDMTTMIEHIDDLDKGIRAEYIEVLVSKKALE